MNRFTFGKDWRSWIIGIAWDKRQFALAIGPLCWVYWRSAWRKEQAEAVEARTNSPPLTVSGGRNARRRRRR